MYVRAYPPPSACAATMPTTSSSRFSVNGTTCPMMTGTGRGRVVSTHTRRKPSPKIRVPPPMCPAPNNHSVWFTKGTQSIKQAPARKASSATATGVPPQTVSCTWARPLPAVVRAHAAGDTGGASNHSSAVQIRWTNV